MYNGSQRIPSGKSLLPGDSGDGMGWDTDWQARQALTSSASSLALIYSYAQTVLELKGTCSPSVQLESWPTSMRLPSWRNSLCYVICDARSGLRPRAWWTLGKPYHRATPPAMHPLFEMESPFKSQPHGSSFPYFTPRFGHRAPPTFLLPSALRCFSLSGCGLFLKNFRLLVLCFITMWSNLKNKTKQDKTPLFSTTGQ